MQTVADIRQRLAHVSAQEFEVLERSLRADTRKGVQQALEQTRRRLAGQLAERQRLEELYRYEQTLVPDKVVIGLDEVGRGPLAGPLSVGAVVLDKEAPYIERLNDSKRIPEARRPAIAEEIQARSLAWTVVHVEPATIDQLGITACLKQAFREAIGIIEQQGITADVVLLDGNPLHLDPRELNVVHGDAKCASIAAASLVAKVARDARMVAYDKEYPGYDFASSKGYGSQRHRDAIAAKGLSPIHRVSFCQGLIQGTLF